MLSFFMGVVLMAICMPKNESDYVLLPDESLDTLKGGALRLIQHQCGYRFSVDPVLLADFVSIGDGDRVIDLGCGGGIISLLLARWTAAQQIVGIELQGAQVDRARRNVVLNGLESRIEIHQGDLRELTENSLGLFDRVVSNPPFRTLASGQRSCGDERARSRHELSGGLNDFLATGSALLRQGGSLSMIHLAERLVDILAGMRDARIEPKRIRMIHSRIDSEAQLVLVEGRKLGRPGIVMEAPLFVYEGDNYSDEVAAMYR
ncbi:MAG: tRNA1(Val) (adenine(37)-N6)-methyltransferase [Thermodesulfobacteriota bacterium]|nr:tRNA1(Val) (adenine(37)-N6)-methyltransferase [Thermodesulfobacteriota bacterium]